MRSTASTPSVARLLGAFALVALGTALLMATDLLLPNVTQSGLQQNAVRLPAISAVPAGAGDTLIGLLALPVALLLASPARGARRMAVAWNVLGILDLVDAVTLTALTSPGASGRWRGRS
jgi:hypothetical protein